MKTKVLSALWVGWSKLFCFFVLFFLVLNCMGETLIQWTLESNSVENGVQVPSASASCVSDAMLSLGGGVTAKDTKGFGGNAFMETTAEAANEAGDYFEVALDISAGAEVSFDELAYRLARSGTGPQNLQWLSSVNGGSFTPIGEEITFSSTSSSEKNYSLPLDSLGELNENTHLALRLVAWSATKEGGTIFLKSSMTFGGAYSILGPIPLSISPIASAEVFAARSFSVPLSISGDGIISTNVVANTEVTGEYGITDGVFYYTPAESDVAYSPVTFTISVSTESETVNETFSVIVRENVSFFENFESAYSGSYALGEFSSDVTMWRGTNFVVKTPPAEGDQCNGSKGLKFQGYEGYVEMAIDKALGVGSISLYHGLNANSTGNDETFWTMSISTDGGKSFKRWSSAPVQPSTTFELIRFDNINIEGNVRLRFEYISPVKSRNLIIDDIAVSDYGEAPAPPPFEEDSNAIRVRSGISIEENFDSLLTQKEAELPKFWRLATTNEIDGTYLSYENGQNATTQYGGTNSLLKTAGYYNLGDGKNDEAADRAVGFMSSGSNYRTMALMVPIQNVGLTPINSIKVEYSIEKYRTGTAKLIELCTSKDGCNWTVVEGGRVLFEADEGSETWLISGPETMRAKVRTRVEMAPGDTLYLGWIYRSEKAAEAAKAQVLGIDDVKIRLGERSVLYFH